MSCDVTEDGSYFSGSATSPIFVQKRYCDCVSFGITPRSNQQISSAVFKLQLMCMLGSNKEGEHIVSP